MRSQRRVPIARPRLRVPVYGPGMLTRRVPACWTQWLSMLHDSLMAARPAVIRTPDQRIRVFVSSTLKELEPERDAVRAAIEQLRLAPVMFELGARPHPPRDLYRSYLAQSDVFVGIYGERYGWIAPDEELSGLEDEYRLSTEPAVSHLHQGAGARARGAAERPARPHPR